MADDIPSPLPRTTAAVEDYLERIRELIQKKGYARVVDIAAELKISQASVTTMVQRLDAEGLVKYVFREVARRKHGPRVRVADPYADLEAAEEAEIVNEQAGEGARRSKPTSGE